MTKSAGAALKSHIAGCMRHPQQCRYLKQWMKIYTSENCNGAKTYYLYLLAYIDEVYSTEDYLSM